RVEVLGADEADQGLRERLSLLHVPSLDLEAGREGALRVERERAAERRRDDAGARLQRLAEALREAAPLLGRRVIREVEPDPHREHALRVDAWVDVLELQQAPDEEPGADPEDERD